MSVYKFKKNDVYINTLKTYPEVKYFIYNGSAYYNNTPDIAGANTSSIRLTDPGSINLYELNIDRQTGDNGYITSFTNDVTDEIEPLKSVANTGLIYQYMVKDATRLSFNSVTSGKFSAGVLGEVFTGSFPYTSKITKEFYPAALARYTSPIIAEPSPTAETDELTVTDSGSVTHLRALKTTINHYDYISPHFSYSSDVELIERDFDNCDVGLISIPTIFYGTRIKPGSMKLDFYVTGTLIGRLEDKNQNGVLYQTAPAGSNGSGSVAGIALYSEGFIVLTGSWDISNGTHTEAYVTLGVPVAPAWTYFGQSISGSIVAPNSSFLLEMSGTSKVENITMFATAPKGELNQSNNPTFINFVTGAFASVGSDGYIQNQNIGIKNIVSSSYNSPTASFERTTYISKVGIYDKDMNLVAIAKPATPIKKVANRDFTFKIELDI